MLLQWAMIKNPYCGWPEVRFLITPYIFQFLSLSLVGLGIYSIHLFIVRKQV